MLYSRISKEYQFFLNTNRARTKIKKQGGENHSKFYLLLLLLPEEKWNRFFSWKIKVLTFFSIKVVNYSMLVQFVRDEHRNCVRFWKNVSILIKLNVMLQYEVRERSLPSDKFRIKEKKILLDMQVSFHFVTLTSTAYLCYILSFSTHIQHAQSAEIHIKKKKLFFFSLCRHHPSRLEIFFVFNLIGGLKVLMLYVSSQFNSYFMTFSWCLD